LVLADFGMVTIVSVGDSEFQFVLSQEGKDDLTLSAIPVTVIASSAQTTALCNTWKTKSITVIDTTTRYNEYPDAEGTNIYIMLSQYGTYMQRNIVPSKKDHVEYGTWVWSDESQTAFLINDNSESKFNVLFS